MFNLAQLKIVMKYFVFMFITECLKTICYVTTLSEQNICPLNHLIITRTSQVISRSLDQKTQTCLQIFGSHLSTDFQASKIENVSVLSKKLGKLFTVNARRFFWSNQGFYIVSIEGNRH